MESTELEVTHFEFRLLPKVLLEGTRSSGERVQLICCTKYGHLLVARGCDLAVYELKSIHEHYKTQKPVATVEGRAPVKEVRMEKEITHLSLSSDHNVLAVVVDNTLLLMDVRTLTSQPAVFTTAALTAKCAGIMWNPGGPTVLATCTEGGDVAVWELRGDSLIQSKSRPTFGASSICWSSKGKQLAVGTKDGKIFNLKPTLDEARCTLAPQFLAETGGSVRDIFWVSTFEYIAVYEIQAEMRVVYIQNVKDKTVATKFTDYNDIFYCEPGRSLSTLFSQLAPWNTLILACSRGMEVAAIGAVPGQQGSFLYNLDENSRAEMPYVDGEASYPTGLCVDYTYTAPTVIGETTLPPTPVLLVLTSQNMLCSYRLMNSACTDALTADASALPAPPPTRMKSVVNITKPAAAPVSTPAPAPVATLVATPAPTMTASASFGSLPKVSSSGSLGLPKVSSSGSLFAAPTSGSLFGAPSSNNLNQLSGPPKPSFGLAASNPAPISLTCETPKSSFTAKAPLTAKPSLATPTLTKVEPAAPAPAPAASKPLSKKEEEENQAAMDSIFAQSIEKEIKQFGSQLEQHKSANLRMQDINDIFSKEEIKERGDQSLNYENQLSDIKSILDNVNTNLQDEKDTLLVALASLEEAKGSYACYKDPAYLAIMRSKPLDKLTKKRRNDVHAKFAQMHQLVEDLNLQLDKEWEDMHVGKHHTPSSRTIYKTLSQHRTISSSQEKLVDTLIKQISNITMTPLSPPTPKVPTAASISPVKKRALKGFLDNYKPKSRVITSPAKLNISSYNSIKAKPLNLAPESPLVAAPASVPAPKPAPVNNKNTNDKPEPTKFGIPTLQYSEKPKFDSEDPTLFIEADSKCPSVVLQYRPAVPPVVQTREEKTRGAQQLVTQFMQKIQQDGTPSGDNFSQQYVPVMRTKGPVLPGQAPNAVIVPSQSNTGGAPQYEPTPPAKTQSAISLFGQQVTGSAPNPYLPISSPFGLSSTGESGKTVVASAGTTPKATDSTPVFSFFSGTSSSTPPPRTTPVIDARTMGTPPSAGVFAPVSTPPPNPDRIATNSPILVTPKSTALFQPNQSEGGYPVVGSPALGNPVVGSPARGSPLLGNPIVGSPLRGSPLLGNPVVGSPVLSERANSLSDIYTEYSESETESVNGGAVCLTGLGSAGNPFGSGAPAKASSGAATPNIFAQAQSSASPLPVAPTPGLFGQTAPSSSVGLFGVTTTNSSIGLFAPAKEAPTKAPLTNTDVQKTPEKAASKSPLPGSKSSPLLASSTSNPLGGLFLTTGGVASSTAAPGGLFGATSSSARASPIPGGLFGATSTTSTSGGLFGATSSAPVGGLFGATSSTSTPAAGGLFGTTTLSTSTPAAGGLFGTTSTTPSATSSSGGLFGASTSSTTPGGLFGVSSTTSTPAAGGLFGTTSTAPASGGLFGATTPAAAGGLFSAPSGGLFGATSTSAPAVGGLFGATTSTTPASGGLFGTTPVASPAAGGMFGANSSTTSSGGMFGASPAPAASGGMFGATSAAPATGGNPSGVALSSGGGMFGSAPSTGFGAAAPTFGAAQPAFGAAAPAFGAAAPAFGAAAPAFNTNANPGFGSGPAFGAPQVPAFGSTFGSSGSVFGSSTAASVPGATFGAIASNPAPGGFGALAAPNTGGGFLSAANNTNVPSNSSSSFSSWR